MTKKEKILVAAQAAFAKYGYAGTTMKMVAEMAGVASGLVSHYYGSKEHLFMVAGQEMVDTMLKVLRAKVRDASSGRSAVGLFVKAYLDFTLQHQETFPTLIRCSPFSDDNPDLDREKIGRKFSELIRELADHIQRGIDDGSIRDVPVEETAFMIYGSMIGAVRTMFLTPYDVPGLYEEACQFVMRSLAAE